MTLVIWLSVTVASVVATCVIRFGNAGAAQSLSWPRRPAPPSPGQPHPGSSSQVSVTCSLYPSQKVSRLTPHRSGKGGALLRRPPLRYRPVGVFPPFALLHHP